MKIRLPWGLLAALGVSLAVGLVWGASRVEDPGPRAPLLVRSEALVHGVGRAAHVWSFTVLAGVALLLFASLFFARRARSAGGTGQASSPPLRRRPRRWIVTAIALAGVAECVRGSRHVWGASDVLARMAPGALTALAAIVVTAWATAARPDTGARGNASRLAFAAAWLGLLAVLLSSAWAPLRELASLQAFEDRFDGPPRLHEWLSASAGAPRDLSLTSGLLFLVPVFASLLLLTPLRAAPGGLWITFGYQAAAVAGFVAMGVYTERALAAAEGLSARVGRSFANTYLPRDMGGVDACADLPEADVVTIGQGRVSIGGVDAGPTPTTTFDCEALAWKLVERARSRPNSAESGFERLAWVSADPRVPFGPVGCLVSTLWRIATGDPSSARQRSNAPRMVWVGAEDTGGLRCFAQLLFDPAAPRCERCEPEKIMEARVQPDKFVLLWKQAGTTISVVDIPRTEWAGGDCPFPALCDRTAKEWRTSGSHLNPADHAHDVAIVRAPAGAAFQDALGAAGSVASVTRPEASGGNMEDVSAFDVWMFPLP
jgi:hypothetical protein